MKSVKQGPGSYEVTLSNGAEYTVYHNAEIEGRCKWVFYNVNEQHDYSDPYLTKRAALETLARIEARHVAEVARIDTLPVIEVKADGDMLFAYVDEFDTVRDGVKRQKAYIDANGKRYVIRRKLGVMFAWDGNPASEGTPCKFVTEFAPAPKLAAVPEAEAFAMGREAYKAWAATIDASVNAAIEACTPVADIEKAPLPQNPFSVTSDASFESGMNWGRGFNFALYEDGLVTKLADDVKALAIKCGAMTVFTIQEGPISGFYAVVSSAGRRTGYSYDLGLAESIQHAAEQGDTGLFYYEVKAPAPAPAKPQYRVTETDGAIVYTGERERAYELAKLGFCRTVTPMSQAELDAEAAQPLPLAKIAKTLKDSHCKTGAGFYVDFAKGGCVRCWTARVRLGKLEVQEIGSEHWHELNPRKDHVRDGYGSRFINITA